MLLRFDWRCDSSRRTVDLYLSPIGLDRTTECLDQGALAGAIFTNQGENLSWEKLYRNILQGLDARKGLGDVGHPEQRILFRFVHRSTAQGEVERSAYWPVSSGSAWASA